MDHSLIRMTALGMLTLLIGCAAPPPPPPPPPPTLVNVTLSAAPNVNQGVDGQGAPVTVRIYQLASGAGFGNAEFYRLYNADAGTLGADLLKRDDIVLTPSASKTAALTPGDTVKTIGFFAAYRDFPHVTWRGTADVPPHLTTNITVTAGAAGLTVKAVTLPPPPPPPPPK